MASHVTPPVGFGLFGSTKKCYQKVRCADVQPGETADLPNRYPLLVCSARHQREAPNLQIARLGTHSVLGRWERGRELRA